MPIKKYNLRVYGLLINNKNQVLISKETRFGKSFTKFPGGGHELGESLNECLQREFQEELGIDIKLASHFYTTDFLQVSDFDKEAQLISVYYKVSCNEIDGITNGLQAIDLQEGEKNNFYWQSISEISETTFTFAIDKLVGNRLKKEY